LYGTVPEEKEQQEMFRKTVCFNRKSGDMIEWRDQFNDLKSHLENILLQHQSYQAPETEKE
jgi:hypothetical protein